MRAANRSRDAWGMRRRHRGPADPDEAVAAAQHCPERRVVRSQLNSNILAAERVGVTRTSVEGLCSWRGRATPRSGGDPRGGHRSADPSPRPAPSQSSGSYAERGLGRPLFPPSDQHRALAYIAHASAVQTSTERCFTNTQDAMFTNAQELGRRRGSTGRAPTCPRRRCPAVADRQPPAGVRPLSLHANQSC